MPRDHGIRQIISGGQTGVDRGALDAAIALGIPHGGHCPRGRRAEDGRIPPRYCLTECESARYAARTELNVLSADATMILCRGPLSGGTKLTEKLARRHAKPCLIVDLDEPPASDTIHAWLAANRVSILNIAGPRESQSPGIQEGARDYLLALLR
ncbi:MAG: putative molybdenum carrier protein [Planctomycetes bacterium]|nr:putative molybdenum carrier protein [Planctomycetota bacterium]